MYIPPSRREIAALKSRRTRATNRLAAARAKLAELDRGLAQSGLRLTPFGRTLYLADMEDAAAVIAEVDSILAAIAA